MDRRFEHRRERGQEARINGFARRAVVAAAIFLLAVIILWLLHRAIDVFLLLFGGVVIAVLFHSMAEPLARRTRAPVWVGVLAVVVGTAAVLALAGWLLAGSVSREFDQLTDQLPAAIDRVRSEIHQFKWSRWLIEQGGEATSGRNLFMQATRVFSITLSAGAAAAIILFLALYMAASPRIYVEGTVRLIPVTFRPRARQVIAELYRTLRLYLLTKLVSMVFVGICVTLGLWLMGVPLPLALGLLAGLFEFIPTIGPLLSAAPAVLLAFVQSPMTALYVALLYFVVQWVQNHVTNPLLQQRTLALPPALSLALVALLGALFGFGGLLVSGPLSIVVLVLVKMLYVEDVLEQGRDQRREDRYRQPRRNFDRPQDG